MFVRKRPYNLLDRYAWLPFHSDYERTSGWLLIESALRHLEKNRSVVLLKQKNLVVSRTVLLDHTRHHLLFDLPPDLKIKSLALRIVFNDQNRLDCYFDTWILYIKNEIIYAQPPDCLIRLQRRVRPRLEIPEGSRAEVSLEDGSRKTLMIRNISEGGMLCCGGNENLRVGSLLSNLDLLLPALPSGSRIADRLRLTRGRVVRIQAAGEQPWYGIDFASRDREHDLVSSYIRQLRIELDQKYHCER